MQGDAVPFCHAGGFAVFEACGDPFDESGLFGGGGLGFLLFGRHLTGVDALHDLDPFRGVF
ncbi:MAG: hypothetical protein ACK55I_30015, partial [bacterium]